MNGPSGNGFNNAHPAIEPDANQGWPAAFLVTQRCLMRQETAPDDCTKRLEIGAIQGLFAISAAFEPPSSSANLMVEKGLRHSLPELDQRAADQEWQRVRGVGESVLPDGDLEA